MNSREYGRGPWFGNGGRGNGWLLPLVVGIGIGALLFTLLPGMLRGIGHHERAPFRAGAFAPAERDQAALHAGAGDPAPHARMAHGPERERHGFGAWGLGGLFFPFAGSRLLGALLLIGAGAWLLAGRTRGPGGWNGPSGPQAGQPASTPNGAFPAEPRPRDDWEQPSTGGTRYL